MSKISILSCIKKLRRPVFTTHELSALSDRSLSATTQALNLLEKEGVVERIYRGIWADAGSEELSPYAVIQFLIPHQRAYVSFISALHLHGIIEQIPQVVSLASTVHTKTIRTKIATYRIHQISSRFFSGFGWYKGGGSFLIAEPEKALVDCLYISARKKKQFGFFPELNFPKSFSVQKARRWVKKIPDYRIRRCVEAKLGQININRG